MDYSLVKFDPSIFTGPDAIARYRHVSDWKNFEPQIGYISDIPDVIVTMTRMIQSFDLHTVYYDSPAYVDCPIDTLKCMLKAEVDVSGIEMFILNQAYIEPEDILFLNTYIKEPEKLVNCIYAPKFPRVYEYMIKNKAALVQHVVKFPLGYKKLKNLGLFTDDDIMNYVLQGQNPLPKIVELKTCGMDTSRYNHIIDRLKKNMLGNPKIPLRKLGILNFQLRDSRSIK